MLRRVSVDAAFCIMAAAAFLVLPLKWLFAVFCAATVHELFHYLALRLCRVQVYSVRIGWGGAVMETDPMSAGKEMICALAGPLGGALLAVFTPVFPAVAVCAFVQSAFNLLPIFPLDGGRVLRSIVSLFAPPVAAKKICAVMQIGAQAVLLLVGIYFTVQLHLGILPLAVSLLLLGKKTLQTEPLGGTIVPINQ